MWLDAIAYALDCACAAVITDAILQAYSIPLPWRGFGLLYWCALTPVAWILLTVHPWGLVVALPAALLLWLHRYAGA